MLSMANEKPARTGTARLPDGDDSDYPELATTPQWRAQVKEARRRQGLNQGQIAARLGTTQPTISDIETGAIAQSKLVTPISDLLGVSIPYASVEDDLERRWIDAGRLLRARHRGVFSQQLASLESLIKLLSEGAEDDADDSGGRGH